MIRPPGPDIPRDPFGRPLIVPVSGRGRVAYRRTTTFVGVLEDTAGLRRWELRQAVSGISARPDLVLAAAAADPSDKTTLDEIAAKATEHASAAATTGTALHALTERLDRGQKLGPVPDPYGADLRAYERATAGIEWTDVETFRVLDEWRVAGTADRIGFYDGQLMIADIKTGSVDYPSKFAMQMAAYAHSLPYDTGTDTRGAAETGMDLTRGLIIHLPAGQGRCDLYLVDIEKGWELCQLAKQVWDARGVRGLLQSAGATTFVDRARNARDVEELRELWRDAQGHKQLTKNFIAVCERRRQELAADISERECR